MEALEWNLPVVTMAGELMRGRHSAAILSMMGVEQTITEDRDGYVEMAIKLALEPDYRAEIAESISQRKSVLYRDRQCIESLERFLNSVAMAPSREPG